MAEAAEVLPAESSPQCYHCKSLLSPTAPDVCPECGRAQTRVCFCGTRISRALAICPQCGVDWSRIRRTRRRSREERRADASRAAIVGGAIALVVAGVAYGVWRLIESGHAAAGADAARGGLTSLGAVLLHALEVVWAPLLVFALGAVGGTVIQWARQQRRRSRRRRVTKRPDPSAAE
jgi:hypothetical protein